uniref:Macaca fascicularis brain cDNA clone: QflA-18937, similar to human chemokine (C-C motif) ligand 5 (CCL5), mRNA, RefSeq: NM_002985.2 n=1 Tax=Macaca fascicularis TaxID=9541 RepID=I7GLN1_MACFA|nr:unnamed protein product [Macaca fascicularis]
MVSLEVTINILIYDNLAWINTNLNLIMYKTLFLHSSIPFLLEGFDSRLIYMVVGKIQVTEGCWTENPISSLTVS